MMKPSRKYPVIDVHTHASPAHAELLAEVMEASGLVAVVNLGELEWCKIPFEEGMRTFRKVLGDRMVYFPLAHFHDTSPGFGERMAEELERKVEAGAAGLKVLKGLGLEYKDSEGRLIPVDDPRLDVLWAKAGELGVPVLIHTADPFAFFQPLDENNYRREELEEHPEIHLFGPEFPEHDVLLAQRDRVIERHPGTTFIGAHLGWPEKLDDLDACLARYPNFYVDTSAAIPEYGRHPPEEVRAFFVKHQDRVLFGTDVVMTCDASWLANIKESNDREQLVREFTQFYADHWRFFETNDRQIRYPAPPHEERWRVDAIGLPDDVLEKLYVGNARRLIPGLQD